MSSPFIASMTNEELDEALTTALETTKAGPDRLPVLPLAESIARELIAEYKYRHRSPGRRRP